MPGFLSLRVPLLRTEVAEDDEVAPVVGHHLPVAGAERPVRPPAVLDEPGLADGLHRAAADGLRPPALARADLHGLRRRQPPYGSHGASVCLRSGTRESGSTGTIRSAASGPAT